VPGFAYVVVASGALMGLSMGMQIVLSIYQMWLYPAEIQPVWHTAMRQQQVVASLDQAV